jgi:hypothetical protein
MPENNTPSAPIEIFGVPAAMDLPCEILPTGIVFDPQKPLTLDQWQTLGGQISKLHRCSGFLLGDWINYGDAQKDFGEKYIESLQTTGLDLQTLTNYSYVARHVPMEQRKPNLSWEHHAKVAKLKDPKEQQRWLNIAADAKDEGKPMSTRILAKSIIAGRVLTAKAIAKAGGNKGVMNVIPFVNRICVWWRKMKEAKWLEDATPEQRRSLKRDLEPIVEIYREL